MSEIKKYKLIYYYDVWGNERDGWDVNDLCVEAKDLVFKDNVTDREIFKFLKEINFLKKTAKFKSLEFDKNISEPTLCEVRIKNNSKPFFRIEEMY